jgi:hypothetical protein
MTRHPDPHGGRLAKLVLETSNQMVMRPALA